MSLFSLFSLECIIVEDNLYIYSDALYDLWIMKNERIFTKCQQLDHFFI